LRQWLATLAFRAAYRQARRVVVEAAIGQMRRATSRAVRTLVRKLRCGTPKSSSSTTA
jgi:hypothetical protein